MSLLLHEVLPPASAEKNIAMVQGDRSVTYRELDDASSRLATLLREKRREWPTPLVGISSTVTIESVIAILGVLKAGLAYVPLDVRSPPDRLARIVADAQLKVLLLDPIAYPDAVALAKIDSVELVVWLDADQAPSARALSWGQALDRKPAAAARVLIDDLAYVLYTSGSTGEPKGVMLTHRNARTFTDWMMKEFQVTSADRVMSRSPLNFDLSVFDIFNAFQAQATLIIQDTRRLKSADTRAEPMSGPGLGPQASPQAAETRHKTYVDVMRREKVTILYTTPSTFTTLLDKGGLDPAVPLRLMLYAGEPFRPPLLRALMLAMPSTRVANIYGPTETNIVTCYWLPGPPEGTQPVPIGVEVDDTEIVVVDEQGQLCKRGETGELWVRGGTVCLGYLGKDDLTAQRKVASPFHPFPATFWRTGDYGSRRADGVIVYNGRLDNMVKIRGYRVELGDVESALSSVPQVSLCVVVPLPDERYGSTLVALVVLKAGQRASPAELEAHLKKTVPEYMVPQSIEVRDELPSTSTGKVDRQRLIAELTERRRR